MPNRDIAALPSSCGEQKANQCYDAAMQSARKCIVKLRDTEGVEHVAQVEAASLYEAAFAGLRQFGRNEWSREASFDAAILRVEVWEPPTVHKIRVDALKRWLERAGGSPREVALRHKIRNAV
jgi:hypothetical protein